MKDYERLRMESGIAQWLVPLPRKKAIHDSIPTSDTEIFDLDKTSN